MRWRSPLDLRPLKPEPTTTYRPDVDGLRAVAVLCVIGFHAFPAHVPGGYVGVDVFFVISGFLISSIIFGGLRRNNFSYLEFYKRRIRRIFPALIIVLTVSLVVGWFALLPDDFKQLGKETAASAGFGANILFWTQSGYFDGGARTKPLLHLWSLGVEEQFYLAWPLLLAFMYRRARHLGAIVASLLATSFLLNVSLVHESPETSFYLPSGRLWELLTGALLACVALAMPATARMQREQATVRVSPMLVFREGLAWFGLALIGSCLWLLDDHSVFPGWWAVLPVLGALFLIAAREAWLNRVVLSSPVLVFIGLISYPLYLWHWVALTIVHLRFHDGAGVAPLSLRTAAVAISFILAWATYALAERPIRFSPHTHVGPVTLLVLMAFAGVAGLAVDLSDGGAWRYPTEVRPLIAFDYDRAREYAETAYRADTCFLGRTATFADLAAECIDTHRDQGPLLVLWGDSHAASLYPGLKAMQERRGTFRITQFTASLCPPILGEVFRRRPHCQAFNEAAYKKITELQPDIIVLMGHWRSYAVVGDGEGKLDLDALGETVRRLRAIGVSRVVVVGCLPEWTIAQPRVTVRLWRDSHTAVDRTDKYLDTSLARVDGTIRDTAIDAGAVFVSPMAALCNSRGCRLSTDGNPRSPLAWDNTHLTPPGSEYLITLMADGAFGQPVPLGRHAGN